MKTTKYLPYIVLFLGIISFIAFYRMENAGATSVLAKNTIRFHESANSDAVVDQNLKKKVKDAVVKYINKQTGEFANEKETSHNITKNNAKNKNI